MYFVDLFDKDNNLISHTPFDNKNRAIKYFNLRTDGHVYKILPEFYRIEINNGNGLVFFECEV